MTWSQVDRALVSSGIGPLAIRAMVGVVMVFHGAQKLFGLFDGPGIEGAQRALASMGIPLPGLSVYLAGGAEFFGGLGLIAGLMTRFWALSIAFAMFVAALVVHGEAFDARKDGMEFPLTLAVVSVGIVFTGAGPLSIDRVIARLRSRGMK